jgi:hypothetical protein
VLAFTETLPYVRAEAAPALVIFPLVTPAAEGNAVAHLQSAWDERAAGVPSSGRLLDDDGLSCISHR